MFELTRHPGIAQTTEVIWMQGRFPMSVTHTSLTSLGLPTCGHIMIQGSPVLARSDVLSASFTAGIGPGVHSGTNSSATRPAGSSKTLMVCGQGVTRSGIDPHLANAANIVPVIQTPSQTVVVVLS